MPDVNLHEKQTKRSEFIIRLHINTKFEGTYRVDKATYYTVKNAIEPFRSLGALPKQIKCIETGKIFNCAGDAAVYLREKNITNSYNADATIKNVCKGKREIAYGYHWEFVGE